MSGKLWDSLSADDQAIVRAAAERACVEQHAFSRESAAKVIGLMKEKGIQVNGIADPAAFQARMQPLYDEYRPKIAEGLMDRWLEAFE